MPQGEQLSPVVTDRQAIPGECADVYSFALMKVARNKDVLSLSNQTRNRQDEVPFALSSHGQSQTKRIYSTLVRHLSTGDAERHLRSLNPRGLRGPDLELEARGGRHHVQAHNSLPSRVTLGTARLLCSACSNSCSEAILGAVGEEGATRNVGCGPRDFGRERYGARSRPAEASVTSPHDKHVGGPPG